MTKPGRQKWQHELLHGVCFVTDSWAETKVCRPSLACQTWKEWLKTTSTHSDLSKSSKQTFLLSVNLHPLELGSKELHTQKREIDFTRPLPPLFQSTLERLERVALLDQVGLSREGRDCTRKQRTFSTKNMEVWKVLESAEPPSMLEVYDMRSVTLGRARPLLAESEF